MRPGRGVVFFFETHGQHIVFPLHGTSANDERGSITTNIATAMFGERPGITFWSVHGHVHRAMGQWIGRTLSPCFGIKGRKHATDEPNDGQAMLAIIGQGV